MTAIGAELGSPLILPMDKVRSFESLGTNDSHELFEREERSPEIEDLLNSHTELARVFYERAVKLFDHKFGHHFRERPAGRGGASRGGLSESSVKVTHEWGDWINFGADFYLDGVSMTGWSTQEDWGVWSVVDRSTLRIGPLRRPTGYVRLTMAMRPAVFAASPEQTVGVEIDGQPIEHWDFVYEEGGERPIKVLHLPTSVVDKDGFLTLTFHVRQLVNLLNAGISTDSRELGLGLESIRLECAT
jgi:hypothetical protein